MTDQKSGEIETNVSLTGSVQGQEVTFSFTAPSGSLGYQMSVVLAKLMDKPSTQNEQRDDHICPIHGVPMKKHTQNGDTWYSHKLDDGTWCRGGAK